MGFLDKLFNKNSNEINKEKRTDERVEDKMKEPNLDIVKKLLEILEKDTIQEAIKIDIVPFANTEITDSKFGGVPYIPKNSSIPTDRDGRQLSFLAQINCEQLPENNIYPPKGMMQFWILDDNIMGLNFDDGTDDNSKRVVYYQSIEEFYKEDEINQIYKPFCEDGESYLPITEGAPFGLKFKKIEEAVTITDYRFEEIFVSLWNDTFNSHKIEDLYDDNIPRDVIDYIYDKYAGDGHKIGGYGYFTQTDPRCFEKYREFEVMLLQIDSDWSQEKGYEILWGDTGVGNFFIKKDCLDKLDFSNTLYNWDCC